MLFVEFSSQLVCSTGPTLCTGLEETLPKRFHPNDDGVLLITAAVFQPLLTSINLLFVLAKQRFCFCAAGPLVNHS